MVWHHNHRSITWQCLPASRGQQLLHYNEYRMLQHISSLACRHATTSVRHCWSCIGCRYTIEFSSSWVFWCTWHTMDSRRCTLAMPWRQSVAYHLVGAYALLTQQTDYLVPRTRSKFGERAFCVSGPLVWTLELSPRVTTNCRFHHNLSSPAEDSLF